MGNFNNAQAEKHTLLRQTAKKPPNVVAEGDSWFDYPLGLDVVDQLEKNHGYVVESLAKFGDTLENMTYGSKYNESSHQPQQPIDDTIAAIKKHKPKFFLFSGGGNDVAGVELETLLNHARSVSNPKGITPYMRPSQINYVLGPYAEQCLSFLFDKVIAARPGIHIVMHGYGYAIPDGRAAELCPLIPIPLAGPWLRPGFYKKNIFDPDLARKIVVSLVDRYNQTLEKLAQDYQDNFHYVDLRNVITDDMWENELHLNNAGYAVVATEFAKVMDPLK